ncbi:MAG: nucleotidyltransferase [Gudongella sp.]|jgi:predicted nucleotidyltransferase|nr:nucleotidyltransferase [Gudongella sp.]
MKVAGLITEYNPFHLGHKLHIERSKELSGASHTVCVMSSSFVQRGSPAIVDKWSRAKMAIESGIDLVIELPFVYSVQTAELFALGAVRILEAINIVTHLTFGSEEGEIEPLKAISDLLGSEPESYKTRLREYLSEGMSFAQARSNAVADLLYLNCSTRRTISEIIASPNNILGIEYLKGLNKLNSSIIPVTFKRMGHGYRDKNFDLGLASATAIRRLLIDGKFAEVEKLVPKESFDSLMDFLDQQGSFNTMNNYSKLARYAVLMKTAKDISKYFDVEDGFENRLVNFAKRDLNTEELVRSLNSKRYTSSRVRRLLTHLMMEIDRDFINMVYNTPVEFIRVLGISNKGFELLNEINKQSDVFVINKFAKTPSELSDVSKMILEKEIQATNLYYLGLNGGKSDFNKDFTTSPYIGN